MKKIVLMTETERQAFLNFCKGVESMENDKDLFLKAARLERHEARLTGEQSYWLKLAGIWSKVVALFVIGAFVVLFKSCGA